MQIPWLMSEFSDLEKILFSTFSLTVETLQMFVCALQTNFYIYLVQEERNYCAYNCPEKAKIYYTKISSFDFRLFAKHRFIAYAKNFDTNLSVFVL